MQNVKELTNLEKTTTGGNTMNTMRIRMWAVVLMLFACTFVYTSVMSMGPAAASAPSLAFML